MKRLQYLLLLSFVMNSCKEYYSEFDYYSTYKPILTDRVSLNNQIKISPAASIKKSGKFYLYKNLILLSEINEGYHIIDNTDPTSPKPISFLPIKLSTDIAIKNDHLYCNQGSDIVTIKMDNEQNIQVVGRIENVFKEITPDNLPLNPKYLKNRPKNSFIYGWEKINDSTQTN